MTTGLEALKLRRVTAFSRGIIEIPTLGILLGVETFVPRPRARANPSDLDAVVGWGFKATATRARGFASRNGLRYIALEDGFLRSAGNSVVKPPPISVVLDDLGIYYEARQPSRLEALIAQSAGDPGLMETGREARRRMVDLGLTKYNTLGKGHPADRLGRRRRVLLIDQTFNDQSVAGAGASAVTFQRMLSEALAAYEASDIVVKSHPDVIAGRARGYLDQDAARHGVEVLREHLGTYELLPWFDEIWTVSSGFGFEALMAGAKVCCFAAAFYAGWGLTDDSRSEPRAQAWMKRRTHGITADMLAAAALVAYPRYADPVRDETLSALTAMDRLEAWRDRYLVETRNFVAVGFSTQKRVVARNFFEAGPGHLSFCEPAEAIELATALSAGLLVWGDRIDPQLEETARRSGLAVTRLGPGAMDARAVATEAVPLPSIAQDDLGIDYDATRASSFEDLVNTAAFDPLLVARAAYLGERLVALDRAAAASGGDLKSSVLARAEGRPVVVVVGDLLNKAQTRLGQAAIRNNRALLRAARREAPDAYVVFMEPPGLESRRRAGWVPHAALRPYADLILCDPDMSALFEIAAEVHVNTSSLGLMALLYGAKVVSWGMPAYAGWGVTEDRAPIPRRSRRLSRDELLAAIFLLYPRYLDPQTGIPCEAEDLVRRIEALGPGPARSLTGGRRLRNHLIRLEATVRHILFGWMGDKS